MKNMPDKLIVSEVLELGETLFDTAIEVAGQTTEIQASNAALIEEMQVTAQEFFTALRLLLDSDIR